MEFTPEQLEAIQSMIDEAVTKETVGLKAKNTELLGKLKETKQTTEEIAAAKERAELELAEKTGNIEAIKKQISESYGKEKAALEAKLQTTNASLHKLVVEDGLTNALVKAGIAAQLLPAAKALLQTSHQVEIGEDLTAKIGDDNLTDFVVKWSQGENGKHFLAAPENNGGGAKGANGVSKAATGSKSIMTTSEKVAFIRENGKEAFDKLT